MEAEPTAVRVLIPADRQPPERPGRDVVWTFAGEVLGVGWRVETVAPVSGSQGELEHALAEAADALGRLLDRNDPRSEIARFNGAPAGMYELSPELWAILNQALDMGDETNGGADPTLGAVLDLWRAGRPDEESIGSVQKSSGWSRLRLNRPARAAMQMGGMVLDFLPLLEGLLADTLSERLASLGASHHLARAGRAARGAGIRPDGRPWTVALPQEAGRPDTVVALYDLALSVRGREEMLMDGFAGRPVDNAVVSAAVLAPTAFQAHAVAAALRMFGPYEGPEYAEALNIAASVLEETPRGRVEHLSPAYREMMEAGRTSAASSTPGH